MSAATSGPPLQSADGRPFMLIMGSFQHGRLPGFCFSVWFAKNVGSRKVGVSHVHMTHGYSPLNIIIIVLIGG